jgi:hypothetical protein
MENKLTHADEYKMLRDEIIHHLEEMSRIEFWTATSIGVVYAWLASQKPDQPAVWCICPALVMLAALRTGAIVRRMHTIAEYLKRIEKSEFKDDSELPGWEHYLHKIGHWKLLTPAMIGLITWVLLFVFTIMASIVLSK